VYLLLPQIATVPRLIDTIRDANYWRQPFGWAR